MIRCRTLALLLAAAVGASGCGTTRLAVSPGSEQAARYRAVRKVPLTVELVLPPEFETYTQTVSYGLRSAEIELGPAMAENARRAVPQAFEAVAGLTGADAVPPGPVQATVRPETLEMRVTSGGSVKAACEVKARWSVTDAAGKVLWAQAVIGSSHREDIEALPLSVDATLSPCMEAAVHNHYQALLRDIVLGEWWAR